MRNKIKNNNLTLQRRFPLKYVNLCKILHKLLLQLAQNLAQVKPFKPLELHVHFCMISPMDRACERIRATRSLLHNQPHGLCLRRMKSFSSTNVSGWTVTFVGEEYTNATIICDSDASWNEVFFYCTNKMEELSEVVYDRIE